MKEKQTYKRFDLLSFLAVIGCAGMILFECVFIFELYNRAVETSESPVPAAKAPAVVPEPVKAPDAPAEVPAVEAEPVPAAAVPVG